MTRSTQHRVVCQGHTKAGAAGLHDADLGVDAALAFMHNFRCLENYGKNGSGKSTIGRSTSKVGSLLEYKDITPGAHEK